MEDALSPNTSAFISYLSSNFEKDAKNPTSLPTSAFFPIPVPGRDTPEDTPPSSNEPSQSPEKRSARRYSLSGDSEADSQGEDGGRIENGQGIHKRKASGNSGQEMEEEDDDESTSDLGHEDKRAHGQNAKNSQITTGRKGGRKSGSNEDGQGKNKEIGKAARRKEQNRAAQKAFRERREAKVHDLEEKVAELEAKSYGTSVENENLRGILKRLQEENVALKQSAFTFSMPLSGSGNTSTPAMPNQQTAKPPSPPHSEADEGLRSINDLPPAPQRTTSGLSDSPDSLASIGATSGSGSGDNGLPKLYDADAFNAFAMVIRTGFQGPATSDRQSSSNSSTSAFPRAQPNQSSSSSATGKTSDVDALFASFYPNGYDNVPSTAQTSNGNATVPYPNQQSSTSATYSFGVPKPQSPAAPTFAQGNVNGERAAFNPMAYRDPAGVPASAAAPAAAAQPAQDAWADLSDNSVNDFLASLTGANNETVDQAGPDDDFFNAQLQQILQQSGSGNSPSAAFVLPQNGPSFSPTNYLNMSPSPLNSISNSQSHGSRQTTSNSASPESTCPSSTSMGETYGGGVSTFGPPKAPSELVYIVDDEGKVIKPSELWMKMGLQHEDNLDHLLIDDLCDRMRNKATCNDGTHYLNARDAEDLLRHATV